MDAKLYQELRNHLMDIDAQIEQISEVAQRLGCTPRQVQTDSGEFMMTPLLLAKAQTLNAITLLKTG